MLKDKNIKVKGVKAVSPADTAKSAIEAVNPNQTQTVESPYDTEYNESEKVKAETKLQGTALKKRDRMSGNEAVALAIKQVNPDVMPAFPITPSTELPQMVSTYISMVRQLQVLEHLQQHHQLVLHLCGKSFT